MFKKMEEWRKDTLLRLRKYKEEQRITSILAENCCNKLGHSHEQTKKN